MGPLKTVCSFNFGGIWLFCLSEHEINHGRPGAETNSAQWSELKEGARDLEEFRGECTSAPE